MIKVHKMLIFTNSGLQRWMTLLLRIGILMCAHIRQYWWKILFLMRYRREFVTSAPLSCHAGSRGPMRMRTNVVYIRVMRRLCRREWNWLWNWLCVNQHPWRLTSINSALGGGGGGCKTFTLVCYCVILCGQTYSSLIQELWIFYRF